MTILVSTRVNVPSKVHPPLKNKMDCLSYKPQKIMGAVRPFSQSDRAVTTIYEGPQTIKQTT